MQGYVSYQVDSGFTAIEIGMFCSIIAARQGAIPVNNCDELLHECE